MAYNFVRASSQSITAGASVTAYPLTIALWFNRTTLTSDTLFLASLDFTSGVEFHAIFLPGNINAVAARTFSAGNVGTGQSTTTFTTGEWNHGASVFASSTSRTAYLNAGGANTNASDITPTSINNTTIGGRFANGSVGNHANALIAEVGIWSAALTQPEIASLSKGVTCNLVRPQSLVFYAPLIRSLQDVKGGLTLTNNNGATVANHMRVYQ